MHTRFWMTAFAVCWMCNEETSAFALTKVQEKCGAPKQNYSFEERIAACTTIVNNTREVAHNRAISFYNRGNLRYKQGDADGAIADFDEAIKLEPKMEAAYNNRGYVFMTKGDLDRALRDTDDAIKLNPKNPVSHLNLGKIYFRSKEYRLAASAINEGIKLDPKASSAFKARARARFYSGSLPGALADMTQASALNPKDAYTALWLELLSKRSGLAGQLGEATKQIDMTKWPAPLIRYYLGQLTEEAALAAADDPDPKTKQGQECEAHFYLGERALQEGKTELANSHMKIAAAACPPALDEYVAARAELDSMRR